MPYVKFVLITLVVLSRIFKLMLKPRKLVKDHKFINIWLRQFARLLMANISNHVIATANFLHHHSKGIYELLFPVTKAAIIKIKAQAERPTVTLFAKPEYRHVHAHF